MKQRRTKTNVRINNKKNIYLEIGKNVVFGKDCILRNFIFIGDNCKFGNRVKISNFCEIGHSCIIGNDVNIQSGMLMTPGTKVGDKCFFAAQIGIADEKYPATGAQIRDPVVFGKNIVVGIGAKIFGGLKIGDNSVIAMGSVVTEDVPRNAVVVGVPARIISKRKEYDRKKTQWEKRILKKQK